MLSCFLLSMATTMSLVMIHTSSPLTLMVSLAISSILLSASMSLFTVDVWFCYILVLVFSGGMLVIFLYITSLVPKEKYIGKNVLKSSIIWLAVIFSAMVVFMSSQGLFWDEGWFQSDEFFTEIFKTQEGFGYLYVAGSLLAALVVCSNLASSKQGALQI